MNRTGRNKLQNYRTFKRGHNVEPYLKMLLFEPEMLNCRMGVAPIKTLVLSYTKRTSVMSCKKDKCHIMQKGQVSCHVKGQVSCVKRTSVVSCKNEV